jgi:transcriptional regulator GlxA family with amidase domain
MAERPDTLIRRQDIYRDAIAVIARDYANDLHVDGVARTIGTSRRQLQRVFDQVGGVSFRRLLTEVRMRNARRMLLDTNEPVNLIARRVGYSQPAQFAKTFRRYFGDVPSTYRTSPRPIAVAPSATGATARLRRAPAADGLVVAAAPSR